MCVCVCECVCVCVCVCVRVSVCMSVSGNVEEQNYPKRMNLLRRKVNVKMFRHFLNLHQEFILVKQVLILQRWMFNKI